MQKSKPKTSNKKVKAVGTQKYLNVETQEVMEFEVISIEERDVNFHKVWTDVFIKQLDLVGNQKTRFIGWLIENMNAYNQITLTLKQMSKKSGVSVETIQTTVKILLESDFLIRVNMGVYQINPDTIFKGGKNDRMNVLLMYKDPSYKEKAEETQKQKEESQELITTVDVDEQSQRKEKSKPKEKKERNCLECNTLIPITANKNKKFCSDKCRKRHNAKQKRGEQNG